MIDSCIGTCLSKVSGSRGLHVEMYTWYMYHVHVVGKEKDCPGSATNPYRESVPESCPLFFLVGWDA